jgi:hypothetical protein
MCVIHAVALAFGYAIEAKQYLQVYGRDGRLIPDGYLWFY